MVDCQPYSLTSGTGSSEEYYRAIEAFTDRWLAAVQSPLARPAASFQAYQGESQARSFPEVALEMLVLGVLLREHGCQALNLPALPAWLLARLVETQDRLPLPAIERPVKAVRGLIQGLSQPGEPGPNGEVDLEPFDGGAAALAGRLVDWLEAQGWAAQAERMAGWRDYLASLDEQRAQAILARCLLLAEEFAEESEAALGQYTRGAEAFAAAVQSGPDVPWARDCRARWRYDGALVTRTRVEYHLGMLGTEILTRAYRERFLAAPRKIVIVPDCLCAHSRRVDEPGAAECQARLTSLGLKCAACTPGCKVLQITRLGEKHGFEAYILPDDLRGVGLGSCRKLSGVGVVGVSCVLTNWDAGWLVHAAGVPAQGVLLDYAGCKSHWHDQGIPTHVNLRKLLETVAQRDEP